jgi:hypothetical protein
VNLQVLATQVALSGQKHLNVLRGRVEDRRKVRRGSHIAVFVGDLVLDGMRVMR